MLDGETVEVPIDSAFLHGVSVVIDASDAEQQVEVLALADGANVVGRGLSAPTVVHLGGVTPLDLVLRPVDAFSGGLDALPDPRPRSRVVGAANGTTWVVGGDATGDVPDRVDVVEPWLTTIVGRSVVDDVAATRFDASEWRGPVPLVRPDGRLVLVSGQAGFAIDTDLGPAESVVVFGDTVVPNATAVALAAHEWLLVGGEDVGGMASREVTLINWITSSVLLSERIGTLATARRQPIVARAGQAVVVIGGASPSEYGEVLGGGSFSGPATVPTDGIAWGPTSAVFCGDSSQNIYAWSGDAYGVAGLLDAPRAGAALARLDDGSLLVAGGGDAATSRTAARFAIRSDGQFALVASLVMNSARNAGVFVGLPTRAHMLVGGVDPDGTPSDALSVFTPR